MPSREGMVPPSPASIAFSDAPNSRCATPQEGQAPAILSLGTKGLLGGALERLQSIRRPSSTAPDSPGRRLSWGGAHRNSDGGMATTFGKMRSRKGSLLLARTDEKFYPFWMLNVKDDDIEPTSTRWRSDAETVHRKASLDTGISKAARFAVEQRDKLRGKPPKRRVFDVHDENKRLQLEQVTWKQLTKILMAKLAADNADQDGEREEATRKRKSAAAELVQLLRQRPPGSSDDHYYACLLDKKDGTKVRLDPIYAYAYGPVGDLPMHTCFLLGLVDEGKQIIDEFYNSPEKISLEYIDDTIAWQKMGVFNENPEAPEPFHDGGLYTGESVLHIAIVQQRDPKLVRWLLNKKVNVVARAKGAFFQPLRIKSAYKRRITQRAKTLRDWKEKFFAKLQNRPNPLQHVQLGYRKWMSNENSACDYGELPLSFAASIGNQEICELIVNHVAERCKRGELKGDKQWQDFKVQTRRQLEAQKVDLDKALCKDKVRKLKEQMKKWTEAQFGPPLEEKLSDPHAELLDVKQLKARFFLMNAAVDCYGAQQGNTALHMAVYHRQLHIVNWLMENGAKPSLNILNGQDLTPFTLAARHGYVDIFETFLHNHMRETAWQFGDVQMSRVSLEQLDSFRVSNNPLHAHSKWRSAIEVIVEHEVEVFANDKTFNKLINEKWSKFGRQMYLRRTLVPYIFVLIGFNVHMFLRCAEIQKLWASYHEEGRLEEPSSMDPPALMLRIQDGRMRDTDYYGAISFIVQALLVVVCGPWLLHKGWRQRRLRKRDIDPDRSGKWRLAEFVFKNLTLILDTSSALLFVIAFAFRVEGKTDKELDCLALLCVLMWCNLLNLIMPFKFFGIMVITTYKMLVGDVLRFLTVFIITTAAFSMATTVLFQKSDFPDDIDNLDTPGYSTLHLIWVAIGEVNTMEMINQTRNVSLTVAVHLVYVVLQAILMLNLLIAMMTKTFNLSMEDTHRTWIFPFANLVLRYEALMEFSKRAQPKYRCGEANEPNSAAMTEDDLKKAIFYIVEVGEDQRGMDIRRKRQRQEKEHVKMIEWIEQKVKQCEDQANEKLAKLHSTMEERLQDNNKLLLDKLVEIEKLGTRVHRKITPLPIAMFRTPPRQPLPVLNDDAVPETQQRMGA